MPFPLKPYTKKYYIDQTKKLSVVTIPTRSDNYTFLVLNENKDKAILVDSADHKTVLKTLDDMKLELESVLLTHHHFDHVDGLDTILSKHPNSKLYCSKKDAMRGVFSSSYTEVKDGVELNIFGETVLVLETPGHTVSHLSYYFSESKALFCGDTLFSLGCGRVFEKESGIYESYFESMKNLKSNLTEETLVFCAHEYTKANLVFCEDKSLVPPSAKEEIHKRLARYNFERTIPSDFNFELKYNPFLKASSHEELKQIRTLKDNF